VLITDIRTAGCVQSVRGTVNGCGSVLWGRKRHRVRTVCSVESKWMWERAIERSHGIKARVGCFRGDVTTGYKRTKPVQEYT
jgi:hypothetical protein